MYIGHFKVLCGTSHANCIKLQNVAQPTKYLAIIKEYFVGYVSRSQALYGLSNRINKEQCVIVTHVIYLVTIACMM